MKKMLLILSASLVVFLGGCFEIVDVDQPAVATTGTPVQTIFTMKTFEADAASRNLILGLLMPTDWTVDSVYYEGADFGPDYCSFLHNDSLDANLGGQIDKGWADTLTAHFAPPAGMEWRVYQGVTGYVSGPKFTAGADTAWTDIYVDYIPGASSRAYELGYFVTTAALDFDYDTYWAVSLGHALAANGAGTSVTTVLANEMTLSQNYPNPFNPSTEIAFSIPTTSDVKLVVYDIFGREVSTLHSGVLTAGNYVESWNGLNAMGTAVPSGMYFYRLESALGTQMRKMTLLK